MNAGGAVPVLIADDEPLARERLRRILRTEPDFHLVGEATEGLEAARMVRELRPAIVILDIRLPGLDAFGILRAVGGSFGPAVILVTAHADRAAQAFEAGAVDYLLKPFDPRRLREALHRARSGRLGSPMVSATPPTAGGDRIALRSAGGWMLLDGGDIDAVLSANLQSEVITRDGTSFHVQESLGHLATRLPRDGFLRISRFAVVRLEAVCSVRPRSHGDQTLELRCGRTLIASRTHRHEVLARLGSLRGSDATRPRSRGP